MKERGPGAIARLTIVHDTTSAAAAASPSEFEDSANTIVTRIVKLIIYDAIAVSPVT